MFKCSVKMLFSVSFLKPVTAKPWECNQEQLPIIYYQLLHLTYQPIMLGYNHPHHGVQGQAIVTLTYKLIWAQITWYVVLLHKATMPLTSGSSCIKSQSLLMDENGQTISKMVEQGWVWNNSRRNTVDEWGLLILIRITLTILISTFT